jgi:hypothetical protein
MRGPRAAILFAARQSVKAKEFVCWRKRHEFGLRNSTGRKCRSRPLTDLDLGTLPAYLL